MPRRLAIAASSALVWFCKLPVVIKIQVPWEGIRAGFEFVRGDASLDSKKGGLFSAFSGRRQPERIKPPPTANKGQLTNT